MIITNNEEALRVKCIDVLPEEIGPLKDQLERELANSSVPGIGLAAIQIGIPRNFAIVRCNDFNIDLVNPIIEQKYNKAIFQDEGCLSFPGRIEKTERYQEAYIKNQVEPYSFIAYGLIAVVCQHEIDHMNNILLPDVAIKIPKIKDKIRPNDKCLCGSNLKFKKCCGK